MTEFGAFTDVLAPKGQDSELRREAQVLVATLPDSGQVDLGRRKSILSILGLGAMSVAGGALSGTLGSLATHELLKPDTYSESFIREILRLHSNRPELWTWRDNLMQAGRAEEAELISVLAVHGEGFWDAFSSISRLRELIDHSNISSFSRAYLEVNYATHHRYLGLTHQAFALHERFDEFSTDDRQLNTLLLNHKHMNRHLTLGDVANFPAGISEDNHALAEAMIDKLGVDPASMDAASFSHAKDVSVECVALKGLYLMNICIASKSEHEALGALDLLDQYRKQLVSSLIAPEVANGRERMAVRIYGEAIWNYGRIAPVAFLKQWDRVLERCLDAFYDADLTGSASEKAVMDNFQKVESQELRSPIWVQMALIRSMRDEILHGTGSLSLIELLPRERRFKIRHHSGLQRSLDAMNFAFGDDPKLVSSLNSLASIESPLLLACVREMVNRRG